MTKHSNIRPYREHSYSNHILLPGCPVKGPIDSGSEGWHSLPRRTKFKQLLELKPSANCWHTYLTYQSGPGCQVLLASIILYWLGPGCPFPSCPSLYNPAILVTGLPSHLFFILLVFSFLFPLSSHGPSGSCSLCILLDLTLWLCSPSYLQLKSSPPYIGTVMSFLFLFFQLIA